MLTTNPVVLPVDNNERCGCGIKQNDGTLSVSKKNWAIFSRSFFVLNGDSETITGCLEGSEVILYLYIN